jgi:hypothetical protein
MREIIEEIVSFSLNLWGGPPNMRLGQAGSSLPWKRLFAELTVIVAGVLIALAVDSWWERRQERNQAREYLEQLLVDVRATEGRLRATIETETHRLEEVNSVIGGALQGPWPQADSLELPTGYDYFEPLMGTLTALIQSGDLRLVRNDSIRFELIAFSALIHETETILRHTETTERVLAGRARHSQTATRREANGGRGWGQVDVAGALNDPEIISALQIQAVASQVRLFNLGRLQEPTSRIIRLLRAEVN